MGRRPQTRSTNEPRVVGARGEAQNHAHPQPSLGAPTAEASTNNAPTPNAEVIPTPTPRESLTKNKFCKGIKHGRKYICSNETNDPETINKATELLTEAINRMLKWRVWDPWWVEEWMDEWLIVRDRLETQLRSKYSAEVINDILRLTNDFINYNEQLWKYWHEAGNEVKRIINDLLNGKAEVIIRGNNAPGISIHGKYITLNTDKTKTGTTIHLLLKGLEGISIETPDIFNEYDEFIEGIILGLEATDGYADYNKAAMGTNQVWQALLWSLLSGGTHLLIRAINVNKEDIALTWYERTYRDAAFSVKNPIDINIIMRNETMLLGFMLGMILGDGSAYIQHHNNQPVIRIPMIAKQYKTLEPLFNKLYDLGFKWRRYPRNENDIKENTLVRVNFMSSNAINLAKAIITNLPPILKDLMDALNPEKWDNLRRIAEMKLKYRIGESQIDIATIKFSVNVMKNTVEAKRYVKDTTEIRKIIEMLRAKYGNEFANNIRINNGGNNRLVVVIPARLIERYDDIKRQVIQVLCRKLRKTTNQEKKQIITKHLRRLTPTKGTAAAQLTKTLKNTKHIPK